MAANPGSTEAAPGQFGGAAGLLAAVVQVQNIAVEVYDVVDINNNWVLNNSLNNLNVEVLTGDEAIEVFLEDIYVLTFGDVDVLNNVSIDVDDIVAIINVLGGGFVVVT